MGQYHREYFFEVYNGVIFNEVMCIGRLAMSSGSIIVVSNIASLFFKQLKYISTRSPFFISTNEIIELIFVIT